MFFVLTRHRTVLEMVLLWRSSSVIWELSPGYSPWASLMAQLVKNLPAIQERRCRFNPWVGKILWSRKWQPTAVFVPEKFHGQRSLVSHSPKVHKESDTTEHRNIFLKLAQIKLLHLYYRIIIYWFIIFINKAQNSKQDEGCSSSHIEVRLSWQRSRPAAGQPRLQMHVFLVPVCPVDTKLQHQTWGQQTHRLYLTSLTSSHSCMSNPCNKPTVTLLLWLNTYWYPPQILPIECSLV